MVRVAKGKGPGGDGFDFYYFQNPYELGYDASGKRTIELPAAVQ